MGRLPEVTALLSDAFGRAQALVVELTDQLTAEIASYRPDPEANSIAWLIWHLTRIQDDHVAELAGVEQAWTQWRAAFALPFDPAATGYGQTANEVGQVRSDGELLAGYYTAVAELTERYLAELSADELARVVDRRWDPPVTVAVRLVSVVGDVHQHLGQAAYVRGLAERHARAWHHPSAADR